MNKQPTTELSVQGESLQQLYSTYRASRYLVNRRYQRKLVWSVEEKASLIDSVLQRLPIPLILLAETAGDRSSRLEIIDGLQRLNAIFSYIENQFPVHGHYFALETLADTKYSFDHGTLTQLEPVLDRDRCRELANYLLPVSTYRSASEAAVDEVFRRINSSGRHLSLQEIRQAGSTAEISAVVRRISATIRGDASLTDFVRLEDMPKISITSEQGSEGIFDADIFWVQHGILSREAVRESRDEELVLDILLDLILHPLAASGSQYRNAAFGDGRGPASTSAQLVQARLRSIGADEVEKRFMDTLDLLKKTLDEAGSTYASWTVTQQNPRGVPRHFHALFVAVARLMHDDHLIARTDGKLAKTLKGFWDRDLSIPGGGNWGPDRKEELMSAVKAALRPAFKKTADARQLEVEEHALQFEATLRMALTEDRRFELKQGFCSLHEPGQIDTNSLNKVLRTATAMANIGPGAEGRIFFGVADDKEDADSIVRTHGIAVTTIDRFYVTGTQHELTNLGVSIDEHYRWLADFVSNSAKLSREFARSLASSLRPFRYNGHLLWQLTTPIVSAPTTYDGQFYDRIGPRTVAVEEGASIVNLVRRFPSTS